MFTFSSSGYREVSVFVCGNVTPVTSLATLSLPFMQMLSGWPRDLCLLGADGSPFFTTASGMGDITIGEGTINDEQGDWLFFPTLFWHYSHIIVVLVVSLLSQVCFHSEQTLRRSE